MLRKASTSSGGESTIKENPRSDMKKFPTPHPEMSKRDSSFALGMSRQSIAQSHPEMSKRDSSFALGMARPSIVQSGGFNGASLVGLLASKRLAKRLSSKFHTRAGSLMSSRLSGMAIKKEPTYRLEPSVKFDAQKVEEVIRTTVKDKLEGYKYNPKLCAVLSQVISEDIRDRVKNLNFDRYKIIVSTIIGEKKNQDITSSSRSVWDESYDSFASFTHQHNDIICSVTVYGIYFE